MEVTITHRTHNFKRGECCVQNRCEKRRLRLNELHPFANAFGNVSLKSVILVNWAATRVVTAFPKHLVVAWCTYFALLCCFGCFQLEKKCPHKESLYRCTCKPQRLQFVPELKFTVSVNCSGQQLTELPKELPPNTDTLDVSNNSVCLTLSMPPLPPFLPPLG